MLDLHIAKLEALIDRLERSSVNLSEIARRGGK
jgi:hypothetical protein